MKPIARSVGRMIRDTLIWMLKGVLKKRIKSVRPKMKA